MSQKQIVTTTINGEETTFICEPRQSLLEVLREALGLTGTKEGCSNGKTVNTIEGVAGPAALHPLQQKFLEHAALQCGICTPGFIVAAKALLEKNPHPTEHEARLWLAGNLCRCTGYDKIIRAVLDAAETMGASA
jgi:carbon-monoxide dehydrogenase small subunit